MMSGGDTGKWSEDELFNQKKQAWASWKKGMVFYNLKKQIKQLRSDWIPLTKHREFLLNLSKVSMIHRNIKEKMSGQSCCRDAGTWMPRGTKAQSVTYLEVHEEKLA